MVEEQVILVNENDEQIGLMPKLEAHEKALLHRAFSVFVFNDKNELMLQQRAAHKYHSPKLWTNTCCSHQRQHENNIDAGKKAPAFAFSTKLRDEEAEEFMKNIIHIFYEIADDIFIATTKVIV